FSGLQGRAPRQERGSIVRICHQMAWSKLAASSNIALLVSLAFEVGNPLQATWRDSPCRAFASSRQIVLPQVYLCSSCFDSTSPVIGDSKFTPTPPAIHLPRRGAIQHHASMV